MLKHILPAVRATLVLAVFTGLVFPFVITALAQLLFPEQAAGSLVHGNAGKIVGSSLIAQPFSKPQYFHPRPSAAGSGYAGEASGGTNLGPTSSKLIHGKLDDPATKDTDESYPGLEQLCRAYRLENQLGPQDKVPVDAVTRSASGLDPHISSANAQIQAKRIAQTRRVPLQAVIDVIGRNTQSRQIGLLGEPGVNVLTANLALDKQPTGLTQGVSMR